MIQETKKTFWETVKGEWIGRLRSDKGRKWLLILGAIGIALLAIPEWLPESSAPTSNTAAQEFVAETEKRLGEILSGMEGAGECRIMITLENGVEYVYATQQKSGSDRQEGNDKVVERDDTEETVIVIDSEKGKEGLLVTEIQPTVKGVVVVCEGGDRPEIQARIVEAVTVALNISSKRVCVTKLS